METGTVKWFNPQKGYGFIMPEQGGKDIFVHINAVHSAGMRELQEGQRIGFDRGTERGREVATNLKSST